MKKSLLLFCFLLITRLMVYGQVDCSTIGFEGGTTSGWTLTNGSVTDINQQTVFQNETAGTFENGHYVTSLSDGNDPKILSAQIPMVAPGSTHSIRIGNITRGSRFDRIKTTYLVTPDNTLFQYKFAVILENPNHQPYQQPAFSIQITNSAGQTVSCSYYNVTASGTISGFESQGDIRYRNWTTGAVDLSDYVGQSINIEVTAHGCTEKRHFGYAYFDAQCLKAEVTTAQFCPAYDKTMTLQAPDGFAAYSWSTGETTRTIQVSPTLGTKYWVKIQPFSSLSGTCELQLNYVVTYEKASEPTRQTASTCEGVPYTVGDTSYTQAGTYLTHIKRDAGRCDSLVQTVLTVRPLARGTQSLTICEGESLTVGDTVFTTAGTHVQRISRPGGLCDSLLITQVTLRRFDLAISQDTLINPGAQVQLRVLVPSTGQYRFSWSPTTDLSCPSCAVTWAKPTATTRYTVTVENLDEGCQKSASVLVSLGSCVFYAPTAFTPNNDGVNDVFYVPGNDCIVQIAELVVYDRWGEVIFRRENFPAADPTYGWDGRYQGQLAEPGVYTLKVRIDFLKGLTHRYNGSVTLVR